MFLRKTQCHGADAGDMGLKSHQEDQVHIERDEAQSLQVEVHPTGDQYHVEKPKMQTHALYILLQAKE